MEFLGALTNGLPPEDKVVQQAIAAFRKETGGIDLVWSRPPDEPRDPFA